MLRGRCFFYSNSSHRALKRRAVLVGGEDLIDLGGGLGREDIMSRCDAGGGNDLHLELPVGAVGIADAIDHGLARNGFAVKSDVTLVGNRDLTNLPRKYNYTPFLQGRQARKNPDTEVPGDDAAS